jgi:beta-lactam-binding protein with PASTA domain
MPNLTGQPLGSATLALQDAGMKVGRVTVQSPPLPAQAVSSPEPQVEPPPPPANSVPSAASMIVTQNPAPGQKVVRGNAVNFEVR